MKVVDLEPPLFTASSASRWHSAEPVAVDHSPTRADLVGVAVIAVVIRVILCTAAVHIRGWSLFHFATLRDGDSYVRMARALLGDSSGVSLIDRRVFIGYPALIAALGALGVPLHLAALGLNWASAAVSACLTAVLFRDRRLGWAMATLTPSYLLYSTMGMSESTLLAFTLAGLVLVRRRQDVGGGILLGAAGLIRPMACFAALGALFEKSREGWRSLRRVAVAAASALGAGVVAYQLWSGDALQNVQIYATDQRAYAGQLFAWPFESLIMTPIRADVALWQVVHIWTYVGLTLLACGILGRDLARSRSRSPAELRDLRLSAPWLIGNTLFTLCVGHIWGFYQFHRFILVALPPLLWVFRRYYPKRWTGWLLIGAASAAVALVGVLRSDISILH